MNKVQLAVVRTPNYLHYGEVFWMMKKSDPRFGTPDYEFVADCSRKGKIATQKDGTEWEICSDWSLKLVEYAQPVK